MCKSLNTKKIRELIVEGTRKFWIPYEDIEKCVGAHLNDNGIYYNNLLCTGELDNLYIIISMKDVICIYNENNDIENCFILKRFILENGGCFDEEHICVLKKMHEMEKVLDLPKVVFVNLCVLENFPIPRMSLSVGALASYVRKYQAARVYIADMQMRLRIDEIIDKCEDILPQIVAISVSFGQVQLLDEILQKLMSVKFVIPMIVIGNVIPSLYAEDFIEKYDNVIVSYGEGEESILDIIKYVTGRLYINQVCGIVYRSQNGEIIRNPNRSIDISVQPLPALDTVEDLVKYRGVLTLELSRGCNYGKCTFCPRDHKGLIWRQVESTQITKYLKKIGEVIAKTDIVSHIYFADEEFIGQLPENEEKNRIRIICDSIVENGAFKFDISARVDSVYDPKKTDRENIDKLEMWKKCRDSGLDRLFLGVESGCDNQLKRFAKGTTAKQNAIALQLLTALGINIRIGYITFDPLMPDIEDLQESVEFIARTDVIQLKTRLNIESLYYKIVNEDVEFIMTNSANFPLYSKVSYMLTSLEILVGSNYFKMMKMAEIQKGKKLIWGLDVNMARYKVTYINQMIGLMSLYCQKWIDYNFSIMYTIKSLMKAAKATERKLLLHYMEKYREYSFLLLKSMIDNLKNYTENKKYDSCLIEDVLKKILWEQRVMFEDVVLEIEYQVKQGLIKDSIDTKLMISINQWKEKGDNWMLINGENVF